MLDCVRLEFACISSEKVLKRNQTLSGTLLIKWMIGWMSGWKNKHHLKSYQIRGSVNRNAAFKERGASSTAKTFQVWHWVWSQLRDNVHSPEMRNFINHSHPLMYSFIHPFTINSTIHPFIHPITHPFLHPSTYLPNRPSTHPSI